MIETTRYVLRKERKEYRHLTTAHWSHQTAFPVMKTRGLSDLGNRSEHGGRVSQNISDIEANSGAI